MPVPNAGFGFLKSTRAKVLTLLLLAQLAGAFAISRKEHVPAIEPLDQFPNQLAAWSTIQEGTVEKEVMDVLRADDVLTRTYADSAAGRVASLFVAFFKSQRTGQTPHSPKNCLPGSGWQPSQSEVVGIPVEGRPEPILVNRYVVAKGEDRSVVLYWYQSRDRVIASEYRAKFYLVSDAIRYNRTDTALVRIVVPVVHNDVRTATNTAEQFAHDVYPVLRRQLPS